MPKCYLLAIGGGSSVDQQSNNITLFNLVEQLNFPAQKWPPAGALLPLEVNQKFELRFVLVGDNGLETPTGAFSHRSTTVRYRTRTFGLPAPPAAGNYELKVEYRPHGDADWLRDPVCWPVRVAENEPRPAVTH